MRLCGAGALWFERDHVGKVFAALSRDEPRPGKPKRRRGGREVPVVIAKVVDDADDVSITAIGTGRARRSVTIYPKATGEIVDFPVQAGVEYLIRVGGAQQSGTGTLVIECAGGGG